MNSSLYETIWSGGRKLLIPLNLCSYFEISSVRGSVRN